MPRLWLGNGVGTRTIDGAADARREVAKVSLPPDPSPARSTVPGGSSRGGRVPTQWTQPYTYTSQPLLEIPQQKNVRISTAINAWLGEPIINSASKLTIFLGLEKMLLTVVSKAKEIPDWIPENEIERYTSEYGNNPAQITAAYVKQKCLELVQYLNMGTFFENEMLDTLVAGDAYINIVSNATPAEERAVWNATAGPEQTVAVNALRAKMEQDGRGMYTIYALQGLNPSATWMYADELGRIISAKIVNLASNDAFELNLDNLIQLSAFSWNWTIYGTSHYVSALPWVDIKFQLMNAMYTNAKRYVTPREWLKITGPESVEKAKLPPTEEQMQWGLEILQMLSSGIPYVMPDGWDWICQGAEGKVLRVETILEKVDDAIRTGAQVSRTFTSGAANVPAYATSKLQAGIMFKALNPLQTMAARAIEGRILQRFCLMNGFFEEDGTLISPKVEFHTMPIQGDDSLEQKISLLAKQGWLSPITAWEMEGIDPTIEMERIIRARMELVEPFRSIAPDLPPSQTPDKFNERAMMLLQAKAKGHEYLFKLVGQQLYAVQVGDFNEAERLTRKINAYLIEAHLLQSSDLEISRGGFDGMVEKMKDQESILRDPARAEEKEKAGIVTAEVISPNGRGHKEGLIG